MTIAIAIIAYLTLGAFVAGLMQADDAPVFMAVTVFYALLPVQWLGSWAREIVHQIIRGRE